MDWSTVREDYLVSNRVRSSQVDRRLAHMRAAAASARGVDEREIDMTNMEAFMIQDGRYIDASRDQVVKDHGSFDGYFRAGLGLAEHEIEALRDELVTFNP